MKTKVNFQDLINDATPVLVDFYADWCGPCRAMSPILKKVAKEVGEKAKIVKVNVDINQEVAMRYDIIGVPTFILFQDGKIKWRQSGMVSAHSLTDLIIQHAN